MPGNKYPQIVQQKQISRIDKRLYQCDFDSVFAANDVERDTTWIMTIHLNQMECHFPLVSFFEVVLQYGSADISLSQ